MDHKSLRLTPANVGRVLDQPVDVQEAVINMLQSSIRRAESEVQDLAKQASLRRERIHQIRQLRAAYTSIRSHTTAPFTLDYIHKTLFLGSDVPRAVVSVDMKLLDCNNAYACDPVFGAVGREELLRKGLLVTDIVDMRSLANVFDYMSRALRGEVVEITGTMAANRNFPCLYDNWMWCTFTMDVDGTRKVQCFNCITTRRALVLEPKPQGFVSETVASTDPSLAADMHHQQHQQYGTHGSHSGGHPTAVPMSAYATARNAGVKIEEYHEPQYLPPIPASAGVSGGSVVSEGSVYSQPVERSSRGLSEMGDTWEADVDPHTLSDSSVSAAHGFQGLALAAAALSGGGIIHATTVQPLEFSAPVGVLTSSWSDGYQTSGSALSTSPISQWPMAAPGVDDQEQLLRDDAAATLTWTQHYAQPPQTSDNGALSRFITPPF